MLRAVYVMSGRDIYRRLALLAREQLGVFPALWLGDQRHIEFARNEFGSGCFSAGYKDFLEGVDWEEEYSSETLERYEALVTSADFRTWEPLLLQELNREPEIRFLRPVDREVFVRKILLLLLSKYLSHKPDFFFSSETPHNVVALSGLLVAKWLGVPTLFFQPTSTIGPNLLPRTDLDSFFALPESLRSSSDGTMSEITDFRVRLAMESLDNFHRGALPVRMQAELEREATTRSQSSQRRLVLRGRSNSEVFFTDD